MVLRACEQTIIVVCTCADTATLLERVFSALVQPMAVTQDAPDAVARYIVDGPDPDGRFVITDGAAVRRADDLDELVYQIDKLITIALQLARADLFFLHAAVVAVGGRAIAMPASPGTGKSTLTLLLARQGLEYLSDELAPVNLDTLAVEPYPHAVCLKSVPPPPCELPEGTLRVHRRLHVPVASLGTATRLERAPLAAIAFLRRDGTFRGRRDLTAASAATSLMAHLLNGLAHPHYGLDAAIALSHAVPCFELDVSDLQAAAGEVAAL